MVSVPAAVKRLMFLVLRHALPADKLKPNTLSIPITKRKTLVFVLIVVFPLKKTLAHTRKLFAQLVLRNLGNVDDAPIPRPGMAAILKKSLKETKDVLSVVESMEFGLITLSVIILMVMSLTMLCPTW